MTEQRFVDWTREGAEQRGQRKGLGETFGDDGYVNYLNCCYGFMGVYMIKIYKIVHFQYVYYMSTL